MANFNTFLPLLERAEGGYQKLSNDTGNYNSLGQLVGTNYGISAPVYEAWIGRVPTETDMRNMSKSVALQIYKAWYWDKMKGDQIYSQSVANILVDHSVNAGTGGASKLVQRVLNEHFGYRLTVDGAVGNQTLNAINKTVPQPLFDRIKEARKDFYESIGGAFLSVWLNRLNLFRFIEKKKAFSIAFLFGLSVLGYIGYNEFIRK